PKTRCSPCSRHRKKSRRNRSRTKQKRLARQRAEGDYSVTSPGTTAHGDRQERVIRDVRHESPPPSRLLLRLPVRAWPRGLALFAAREIRRNRLARLAVWDAGASDRQGEERVARSTAGPRITCSRRHLRDGRRDDACAARGVDLHAHTLAPRLPA